MIQGRTTARAGPGNPEEWHGGTGNGMSGGGAVWPLV
jgi:hypothetical protein